MVALPQSVDVRVSVIASDPLARAGIVGLLAEQPGILVSATARVADADVVAWDLGSDGEGVARFRAWPEGHAPALVMASPSADAADLLAAGARGVVDRGVSGTVLAAALRATAHGLRVVDDTFALPSAGTRVTSTVTLSPREREVLHLVAEGHANKIVADRLGISEHTAKFHINTIFAKLGATTRTEAVVRAVRAGLLTL